jgi:hypothetical protein
MPARGTSNVRTGRRLRGIPTDVLSHTKYEAICWSVGPENADFNAAISNFSIFESEADFAIVPD